MGSGSEIQRGTVTSDYGHKGERLAESHTTRRRGSVMEVGTIAINDLERHDEVTVKVADRST